MGMGMKSLKWEGIGTKNLFPHTSTANRPAAAAAVDRRDRQTDGRTLNVSGLCEPCDRERKCAENYNK